MKMKYLTMIMVSVSAYCLCAHTSLEQLDYAEHVVRKMAINEWDDCIDDKSSTNELVVVYPTVESVFEDGSDDGDFSGWTANEKRAAFNQFLDGLGDADSVVASARWRRVGAYALLMCSQKNYTNALSSAMKILRNSDAPCCAAAVDVALKLGQPTSEMNLAMLMVATNRTNRISSYKRCSALREYFSRVNFSEESSRSVGLEAARLFYANRNQIENLVDLDRMLSAAFTDYDHSSNRLEVAMTAIVSTIVTDHVREHFVAVTNSLMNSAMPLCFVQGL